MTEIYSRRKMRNDDDDESPTKCRERRRRRVEMMRLAAISTGASYSIFADSNSKKNRTESSGFALNAKRSRSDVTAEDIEAPSTQSLTPAADILPVFGSMSVAGRSREMEDEICVRTNLCRPEINRRRPVHFFGVFDGHGGPHVQLTPISLVSALCREWMHVLMAEELMRVGNTNESESGCGSSNGSNKGPQHARGLEEAEEEWWRIAMCSCFARLDDMALNTCACGSVGYHCRCHPMEVPLAGSTAVVAILTVNHIIVSNCGDSRAVLSRAGRAVPLTFDHKPDRADELARIEASGGRVIFVNGARVEGILAMSRALGDKYLKPIVTSEPEISFTRRDPEDECLILASDGLWDVLSNELTCEVASKCLRGGSRRPGCASELSTAPRTKDEGAGALYPSRSASAAALLTRLALGRKSSDNISVIVIDLKSG